MGYTTLGAKDGINDCSHEACERLQRLGLPLTIAQKAWLEQQKVEPEK